MGLIVRLVPGLDVGKAVLKHEAADAGRFGLRLAGVEPHGLKGQTSGVLNWEDGVGKLFASFGWKDFMLCCVIPIPGVTVLHVALELVARRLATRGCKARKSRGFV